MRSLGRADAKLMCFVTATALCMAMSPSVFAQLALPVAPSPGGPAGTQPAPSGQIAPSVPEPRAPGAVSPAPAPQPQQPAPAPSAPAPTPQEATAPQTTPPAQVTPETSPTPPATPPSPPQAASPTEPAFTEPAPAAVPPETSGEVPKRWYDRLDVSAFVDAYASVNFNLPKPQDGHNRFRSFDSSNGFALSWAGLGIGYDAGAAAATVELRIGPSAAVYSGSDSDHGLEFVKEAYATWRPMGKEGALTLDFGKFESPYGFEQADSQDNFNYTRGVLYGPATPNFHTGLRGRIKLVGALSATVLAVNGWDNSVDNNAGKSLGLLLEYRTGADSPLPITAQLGYLGGPEQVDLGTADCPTGATFDIRNNACNATGASTQTTYPVDRGSSNSKGLRHLIDAVFAIDPAEKTSLALEGVLGLENHVEQMTPQFSYRSVKWYGVGLSARQGIDDVWAVAARFEYLGDPDGLQCGDACVELGYDKLSLTTLTGTIEAVPVPALRFRLEGRWDHANENIFPVIRTFKENQLTATLGVVATTD